jgi:hypothetical protein
MSKFLRIFLILLCQSSYAEVYKWVDENGQTRFSDKPPIQNKFETLNMPSSAPPNTTPALSESERLEKQKKLLQVFDEEREAKAKSRQQFAIQKQEITQKCTNARNRLEYISTGVLYRKDKQGERIYYTEEERNAKQKELQLFIQKNCQ